jgi:hypothetical protein
MQIRASTMAGATGGGLGYAFADVLVWSIEAGVPIDIPDKPELAIGVICSAGVAFLSGMLAPLTPAPAPALAAPDAGAGIGSAIGKALSSAPAAAIALMIVGSLVLAGCSAIPGYEAYKVAASGLVDQTIKDRMEWNDSKAEVVRALNCDMSLGAYSRMPDGDEKLGVGIICDIIQPDAIIVSNRDGALSLNPAFLPALPVTPPVEVPPPAP